jgi:hypothetical protein
MKVIVRSSSLLFLIANLLLGLPVNRTRLKKFWSPVRKPVRSETIYPPATRRQTG